MEPPYRAKGVKLKHYHTDGAGDLIGQDVREYLRSIDALYDSSEPYTPELNAHAKHVFRTIGEMANCMLHDSGLPVTFWGYAILTAIYIKNRFHATTTLGTRHRSRVGPGKFQTGGILESLAAKPTISFPEVSGPRSLR